MANSSNDLTQLSINTIRTLSMDAVQKANSGHPGTPMALAPLGYVLWQEFLKYDPQNPVWPNRDRFVLSAGHASMLLYSLLHLSNVQSVDSKYEATGTPAVSLKDIEQFRQFGSKTPGHPEYRHTSGVETTTGPLGQGLANSVGMAMAQRWLATYFNKPGFEVFDYDVYSVGGDGCFMEGVSQEAASLAGHLKLSNLCWFYDSNHITIEGSTDLAFNENVGERFEGYGWNVLHVDDVNNLDEIRKAVKEFKAQKTDKPTLVIVHSVIGYGAPHKQGTREAHGEALGVEEVVLAKKFYGWPEDKFFYVPDEVRENFKSGIGKRGAELRKNWDEMFAAYGKEFPELAAQWKTMQNRELPKNWDKNLPTFPTDAKGVATRDSSGKVLNALAQNIPWLMGGAADLAPSTKTLLKFDGVTTFEAGVYSGRNMHFGIREHAMGSIVNGLSLSKIRPFGATFLIFTDYQKPPVRLSALMEIPAIHIYTHDSIGVGEDGPTHQPVEQLASLRAIPNMCVMRPADANEVVEGWKAIMQLKHRPVALSLTRQNVPTIDRSKYASASGTQQGAYILADCKDGKPEVILMGTGSEVSLCLEAFEKLTAEGIKARVVSMPSWDLFEAQPQSYREKVLPPDITARVAVEQAAAFGWDRYVGLQGATVAMHTFGMSAPIKDLQGKFGFTVENVLAVAKKQVQLHKGK